MKRPARGIATPLTIISVGVFVLVALAGIQTSGSIFGQGILSAFTPLVGIMILASAGQALVISTGGIDLSIPSAITVVGVIMLKFPDSENSMLLQAMVVSLIAVIIMGLINGVLVEVFGLNSLVVTLAVGMLAIGFARLYRGQILNVSSVPSFLVDFSSNNLSGVSYILIASIVFAALGTFVVWLTIPGRRLVASSASVAAGILVGIQARTYRVFAYVIAATLYGVAGILLSGLLRTPDLTIGAPYLLAPIVAVVLGGAVLSGGRVSFVATLLGAVFVSLLTLNLQVAGFTGGAPALAQGLVLALGLTIVFLLREKKIRRPLWGRRSARGDGALSPRALPM